MENAYLQKTVVKKIPLKNLVGARNTCSQIGWYWLNWGFHQDTHACIDAMHKTYSKKIKKFCYIVFQLVL